jgi:hypothetical protein
VTENIAHDQKYTTWPIEERESNTRRTLYCLIAKSLSFHDLGLGTDVTFLHEKIVKGGE